MSSVEKTPRLSISHVVAVIAATLIVAGAFMPLVRVPIFEDDTFFSLSPVGTGGLFVLALVAVHCAFFRRYDRLLLIGALSLAAVVYMFVRVQAEQEGVANDLTTHMANTPLKSLGLDLVFSSQLGYGWYVMASGGTLLLGVALLAPRLIMNMKKKEEGWVTVRPVSSADRAEQPDTKTERAPDPS